MLIDLDPDFWLCTRLLFGHRWRWVLLMVTLAAAGAVFVTWRDPDTNLHILGTAAAAESKLPVTSNSPTLPRTHSAESA